ncbi:MAG: hypothetical protein ACE5I9_11190 [Candidatus Methylomirabilales bacterium]
MRKKDYRSRPKLAPTVWACTGCTAAASHQAEIGLRLLTIDGLV